MKTEIRALSGVQASNEIPEAPRPDDQFNADHLLGNLKNRTISSGIIRGITQVIQFGLILVYNFVIARLLTPSEFGVVAMVMAIVGFLQIFKDMQLSTATVQRAELTHAQVSNLFWLNVAVSGGIGLLMAASSPLIASFYHEPRLTAIALALSADFLLYGLAGQHIALLNRQMRFGTVCATDLISMTLGLSAGIIVALSGYGYWALVWAILVQSLARLVIIWSVSHWRPQLPVRGSGTLPIVSFGAKLTVSGFLYSISLASDGILVGRVFGTHAVGLYTRAEALLARPIEQMITPVYAIAVPVLSRLQNEPERYRRFYLRVFEGLAIASFIFTGLALSLARPMTVALLGSKWEDAGIIFAWVSIAGMYAPLSSAASWLYTSQGRGADMVRLSFIEAVVTLASLAVGIHYGLVAVAAAFSLSGVALKLPLTFQIAGRTGAVTTRDLWSAYFKHLPVFLLVAGTTWGAYEFVGGLPVFSQLFVCAAAGLLGAAAAMVAWSPTRRICRELLDLIPWRNLAALKTFRPS